MICPWCDTPFVPCTRQLARIKRGEAVGCSRGCRDKKDQRKWREGHCEVRIFLPRSVAERVKLHAEAKKIRSSQLLRAIIRAWDTGHTKSAA